MYKVTMKDGSTEQIKVFDGGGCFIGGGYDVACIDERGNSREIPQAEILSVVDENGKVYTDFGNNLFEGHPYPEAA